MAGQILILTLILTAGLWGIAMLLIQIDKKLGKLIDLEAGKQ